MSTHQNEKTLEAIRWIYDRSGPLGAKLSILDQLQLPGKTVYMEVTSVEEAWTAIRNMNVRGAPAIAIVATLALAVEASTASERQDWFGACHSVEALRTLVHSKLDFLETSRPTAVNLRNACNDIKKLMTECNQADEVLSKIARFAIRLKEEDLHNCRMMGAHGAKAIENQSCADPDDSDPELNIIRDRINRGEGGAVVLTHCNTGSLACSGFGTALGVVRELHSTGSLRMAYCTETRPYNQGSRLTAFELAFEGIPSCLICDDMAGALMNGKGKAGRVDAVVVGADRVARNGDTANKIGTYQLAVLAKHHGIPFYVVCPLTTIDFEMATGDDIPIEERSAEEMGAYLKEGVVAEGIDIWNPAFDVTPNALITGGVVTELGVFQMPLDSDKNREKLKKAKEEKVFDKLKYPIKM